MKNKLFLKLCPPNIPIPPCFVKQQQLPRKSKCHCIWNHSQMISNHATLLSCPGRYLSAFCVYKKSIRDGVFLYWGLLFAETLKRKEKKNWLVDLHLDSSNHLDTPHYETGYKLIHLNPETSASFWLSIWLLKQIWISIHTRHPHVGNVCVRSFSNKTKPKHFKETDICGLVDLRTHTCCAVQSAVNAGLK